MALLSTLVTSLPTASAMVVTSNDSPHAPRIASTASSTILACGCK